MLIGAPIGLEIAVGFIAKALLTGAFSAIKNSPKVYTAMTIPRDSKEVVDIFKDVTK